MKSSLKTVIQIAEAFVELCNNEPLEKVSVSDIITATGKNRKTFYYHFENKDDLISWIFRYDMGLMLTDRFPRSVLVFEPVSHKPSNTADYPFYIRNKTGIRSLNQAPFFECLGAVLESRRSFYAQALNDNNPYGLHNYLHQLYSEALKDDIRLILSNRAMAEKDIQYLADFSAGAFLGYYSRLCAKNSSISLSECAGPFGNFIHESLEHQIRSAQARRSF